MGSPVAFGVLQKNTGIGHSFKVLRKTSSSLLANNRDFCSVSELFLGHAPKTIAQKHYQDTPQTILDDGLAWLAGQFGLNAS